MGYHSGRAKKTSEDLFRQKPPPQREQVVGSSRAIKKESLDRPCIECPAFPDNNQYIKLMISLMEPGGCCARPLRGHKPAEQPAIRIHILHVHVAVTSAPSHAYAVYCVISQHGFSPFSFIRNNISDN